MKRCPFCAEEILDEAIYCKYCHHELTNKPIIYSEKKRVPAFVWGLFVGLIIGLLTITRRQDTITAALDLINYPALSNIGSVVIRSLIIGSLINVCVWTGLTTIIIMVFRKIFKNLSEAWILVYTAASIVFIILATTYYYSLTVLSKNAGTSKIEPTEVIINTPIKYTFTPIIAKSVKSTFSTSTPRPQIKLYFPPPIEGSKQLGDSFEDFSKMTADSYAEAFGVPSIDAYQMYVMQMGKKLPPFNEFINIISNQMEDEWFKLVEKGTEYLIFYNQQNDVYIGIIYDVKVSAYRLVQW